MFALETFCCKPIMIEMIKPNTSMLNLHTENSVQPQSGIVGKITGLKKISNNIMKRVRSAHI